jgi:hypothetical protein
MTTLVAIFDNAWTMEQAIERLVARGYDEAVYDEAIISENTGEISVPQAKRAAGPGKPNGACGAGNGNCAVRIHSVTRYD